MEDPFDNAVHLAKKRNHEEIVGILECWEAKEIVGEKLSVNEK